MLLEPEQEELLGLLVEAERKLPRAERETFVIMHPAGCVGVKLAHSSFTNPDSGIPISDIETLVSKGLLSRCHAAGSTGALYVTPEGFRFHDERRKSQPEAGDRIQATAVEALARRKNGETMVKTGSKDSSYPASPSYDVFISYASADSHIATELRDALRQEGVSSFLAEKDIRAGAEWSNKIREAMFASRYVLLLLSPRSKDRPWILIEAGAAWALEKEILPACNQVDIGDVPDFFQRYQARTVETSKQRLDLAKEISNA